MAVFCNTDAHAQAPSDANRTVNLNYLYAAQLGFGGYSIGGLDANVYTLPFSETLKGIGRDDWNLKLLFPVQFGVYEFRATDVDGTRLGLNQHSLSIVPGAELQIPLGTRTVVKPFAQLGIAHAFGGDVGNPDVWVYQTGMRALTQWQVGSYTLSLGNAVILAGDRTVGSGPSEHYVSLQIGGEIRRSLGFTIGNVAPDLGIYLANYYYPTPLVFSRFLNSQLEISNQAEVGFSIGTVEPVRIKGISLPRIGVGYVWGGGLTVWHVNFGFRF